MTEREFEQRLRGYFNGQVETAGRTPAALRQSVWSIPDRLPARAGFFQTRRGIVILAAAAMLAALLIGGALAIGAGWLRLPWEQDDRQTRISPIGTGWVAYVVEFNGWNTPGAPGLSGPQGSTRIALVRDGETTPVYVGGATPPQPGASVDEWLSIRQQCPSFSPDGEWLAYFEEERGNSSGAVPERGDVVITNRAGWSGTGGAEVRQPGVPTGACPVWRPQGDRVAYITSNAYGSPYAVAVLGLDGFETEIPGPANVEIRSLAWSPDGSAIAMLDSSYPDGFREEGRLLLMPVDGGESRVLYEGNTPLDGAPSWSPDGSLIAITASASPQPTPDASGSVTFDPEWHVLVVSADSGAVVQDLGRGASPSWSPVENRLAYVADLPSGADDLEIGSIVVVDLSTGVRRVVPPAPIPPGTPLSEFNFGGGNGIWHPHGPDWSPDGRGLLFIGSDGGWGTSVLLAASAEGGEIPVAVSETWVTEWYAEEPHAIQDDRP